MKTTKVAIKPESSLEALLCLPTTITALRTKHPDASIGVIGEECFREASCLVPGLDFFVSELDASDSHLLYDFSNFAGESWGEESLDWKAYLQGCSAITPCNPYHQIDLFRKAAGAEEIDVNYELVPPTVAKEHLPTTLTGGETLRIGICAASLSINQLQSILEGISQLGVEVSVHLMGTVTEKRKSAVLLSAWDGRMALSDLCGRQSLTATAASYRLCDIAITGPGSAALLSSGYGTFTICVDENRNPLHYPYGHGHLVIQHTESDEFFRALAGLTTEIINYALSGNNGNIPSLDQWQSFADDRIDNYLARLRILATQRVEMLQSEGGSLTELYLRPLLFMGSEHGDVLQGFYRLLWEHSLRGKHLTNYDLEVLQEESLPLLAAALRPMEQLYELANFGRTYSSYILDSLKKGELKRAQHESDRLQEIESLMFALAKTHSALAPICAFHEKRQRLIPVNEPTELAQQMTLQFSQMQNRIVVLLDLAKSLFHTTLQNESALSGPPSEGGHTDG
jgi:hypothetical protein